ncbi:MAG TPA: hypothetical protein ENN39_04000 [Desulfonatronum sp.]|nr:hypothetical protein [Desulfonatronum sp.]
MDKESMRGAHGRHAFPRPAARDRVEQFQSQHSIGERITGTFLHWHSRDLGWVDFLGNPLLASMASRPEPGARLMFLVKRLFPEIVLQEIVAHAQPGILNILQRFWACQSLFETHFSQHAAAPAWNVREMAASFRDILENEPELHREFAKLSRLQTTINMELGVRGLGRYFSLPWLAHHIRDAGVLLPPWQRLTALDSLPFPDEAQFVGTHPLLGHLEIHFALARKPAGFTFYLERFEREPSLKPWIEDWLPRLGHTRLVLLGVKPLGGGLRSGILARLLLPWEPGVSGLHVQV